jgi:hypothetical protein
MRGTIARALAPWVTAEGDGFALLVAAVKIPAIAGFNIYQRKMARIDLDAAQLAGSTLSKIGFGRLKS